MFTELYKKENLTDDEKASMGYRMKHIMNACDYRHFKLSTLKQQEEYLNNLNAESLDEISNQNQMYIKARECYRDYVYKKRQQEVWKMALIKCPECGKEVSDTAKACPNCGYSMKVRGIKITKKHAIIGAIAAVIIVILLLVNNSVYKESASPFYSMKSGTKMSDIHAIYGEPDESKTNDGAIDETYNNLKFIGKDGVLKVRYWSDSKDIIYARWTLYAKEYNSNSEYESAVEKTKKYFTRVYGSPEQVTDTELMWSNTYSKTSYHLIINKAWNCAEFEFRP